MPKFSVHKRNQKLLSQTNPIITILQNAVIVCVAVLYCLAPLQKPISDGFHKLEHAILNTGGNHSHEFAHETDLDHDHHMLAFFNNLLESDSESEHQAVKELKLDKHIIKYTWYHPTRFLSQLEAHFFYRDSAYGILLPNPLPPPENSFS